MTSGRRSKSPKSILKIGCASELGRPRSVDGPYGCIRRIDLMGRPMDASIQGAKLGQLMPSQPAPLIGAHFYGTQHLKVGIGAFTMRARLASSWRTLLAFYQGDFSQRQDAMTRHHALVCRDEVKTPPIDHRFFS